MTAPHMPMMNDDGLLECERCQSLDCALEEENGSFFVYCFECCNGTKSFKYKVNAVRIWNTRNGHLWTKQDFADRAFEMQNSDLLEKK